MKKQLTLASLLLTLTATVLLASSPSEQVLKATWAKDEKIRKECVAFCRRPSDLDQENCAACNENHASSLTSDQLSLVDPYFGADKAQSWLGKWSGETKVYALGKSFVVEISWDYLNWEKNISVWKVTYKLRGTQVEVWSQNDSKFPLLLLRLETSKPGVIVSEWREKETLSRTKESIQSLWESFPEPRKE